MAEVLASLKKIGGNGEQYTETVLWTNPNPNTGMARTTVTLSDSIGNYKYIAIRTKPTKSDTDTSHVMTFFMLSSDMAISGGINNYLAVEGYISSATYVRRVVYQTDTTILIFEGTRLNASGSSNDVAIPLEILGVNELERQTVVGKYAVTNIQQITASTVPTFATRGKPLAIWFTFGSRSSAIMQILTNVNPTTGETNNNELYYAYYNGTSQLAQWVVSEHTFVVTDNSISTSAAVSSGERWGYVAYTYE